VEGKITAVGEDSDANSLIRLMIAAAMGELQGNRRGLRMRIDEVISECKTFFFTGHETTAAFLTWTCFLLAINPQWQERAREDVCTVCGMTDSPGAESASKLKVVSLSSSSLYMAMKSLYLHFV
jgi:cytochrome P450